MALVGVVKEDLHAAISASHNMTDQSRSLIASWPNHDVREGFMSRAIPAPRKGLKKRLVADLVRNRCSV